jgi:hypothetical protein
MQTMKKMQKKMQKKNARPDQSANILIKDDNAIWTLFTNKNDDDNYISDSSAAVGESSERVFEDTTLEEFAADDELSESLPVTNMKTFDADYSEAPSKRVVTSLCPRPKSDGRRGETDESAQQPSLGLIYLISSKHQIKIGSSIDLPSQSLGDILPDMTNLDHRYSSFVLFLYL